MKLTLDHNVVIDFALNSPRIEKLREVLVTGTHQAHIVEIGASEMRQLGIKPDRYDLFEQLLAQGGLSDLPRLAPMMIWDVTFWDHSLWCDETMQGESREIERILFGDSLPIDINEELENSPKLADWLNRVCDVQSMWCHLHYKNDIFVTSDNNFHKATASPPARTGCNANCTTR